MLDGFPVCVSVVLPRMSSHPHRLGVSTRFFALPTCFFSRLTRELVDSPNAATTTQMSNPVRVPVRFSTSVTSPSLFRLTSPPDALMSFFHFFFVVAIFPRFEVICLEFSKQGAC